MQAHLQASSARLLTLFLSVSGGEADVPVPTQGLVVAASVLRELHFSLTPPPRLCLGGNKS